MRFTHFSSPTKQDSNQCSNYSKCQSRHFSHTQPILKFSVFEPFTSIIKKQFDLTMEKKILLINQYTYQTAPQYLTLPKNVPSVHASIG